MPKPTLIPEQSLLEHEMIETMTAGLHNWRPDLDYPKSYSDLQACVRGLMAMFCITRRPLPTKLLSPCHTCEGTGYFIQDKHNRRTCTECHGAGKVETAP